MLQGILAMSSISTDKKNVCRLRHLTAEKSTKKTGLGKTIWDLLHYSPIVLNILEIKQTRVKK